MRKNNEIKNGLLPDELIEYYMKIALEEASLAVRELSCKNTDGCDVPVGCVIGDTDGNVIACAHNTRELSKLVTGHAEISAINEAAAKLGTYKLNGLYIFVTLEPCPMCAGAIAAAQPEAIYYGAPNTSNGACGTVYKVTPPHINVYGGVMSRTAAALIKDFFAAVRDK